MVRLFPTLFVLCGCSVVQATPGIVLYPISQFGRVVLKAGAIVEFTEVAHKGFEVRFEGNNYQTFGGIIPLDPGFTPPRIYLELQTRPFPSYGAEAATLAAQVDLAEAALKRLPRSPLMEEIEAQDVRLTYRLVNCQTEGKTLARDALEKARRYLVHYPQGKYLDEFEWMIVLWSNEVYETEGEASIPLSQARAYESVHAAHSNSSYSEEIQKRIADCYRLGADFLDYGPNAKKPGPGVPYRKKAEVIYTALLESKDPMRSAGARVALYNLRHGRVPGFGTQTSPPMDW